MISLRTRTPVVCLLVIALFIIGLGATTASAQALPSPWTSSDIGSPAIVGATTFNSGTFTVIAGGTDIWGTSDQFRFTYQLISGDVTVTARVDGMIRADGWTKAGVMIRSSLAANAAHGFALVTPDNGVAFQRRLQTGGATSPGSGPSVTLPRWLRVSRVGTRLTAYTSTSGTSWTTIASDTIALGTTAYVGLAVTSHNAGLQTTAALSQVTVTTTAATPVPAPQRSGDIGSPAIAGSASYSQGTYTIRAAGSDIWDVADQFHFVYQPVTGDIDVTARVASITRASNGSRAGVMVRETLAAGSRHALASTSAGNGYAFRRRIDPDGYSTSSSGGSGAAPGWVRLVRTGNRFEAFRSANGSTWTSMGADTVPMGEAVFVGIAVTSRTTWAATTAVLDTFSLTAGTPPVNLPPTVSLTAPASGASYTAPATVAITASAADTDGTVARVVFYNGPTVISTDTTAPYAASLAGLAAGTYALTAVAFDDDGASTTSAARTVQVGATANTPPTVSLTAPATGASYTASATVAITATAADTNGTVSRVEFYAGTVLLGTDTTSPYAFSWTNVPAGSYGLRAVAFDDAGASGSSATSTITVTAPPTTTLPTAVAFQASSNHAESVTTYRLDVFTSTANPATATPVGTSDLGKPTPATNNDITVNRATFFSALAVGNYIATVTAIGPTGSARSTQVAFTR